MIQPNEHLLDIYRVTDRMGERAHYVRMDRNERVTPFGLDVFRDMVASLTPETFCAYPDTTPLYQRLSRDLGLPADHLYLTNGSDAGIRMTFQTFVRAGDMVIFPDPTYAMYAIYTRVFQGHPQVVAYDDTLRLDVAQLFSRLQQRPRLLAIPNPDQPTGAVLSEATLRELAAAAREVGTLFIIDEAYFPFYPHTAVGLVRDFDNVVVTRTFSKVGGLAGLRLGYVVAQPEIVNHLQRIRGAHEVNSVAVAVGSYVLDHPELGLSYLAEVEAGRELLKQAADELGVKFPACPTNFQLLRFTGWPDTAPLVAGLKEKGYLVKGGFSSPAVCDCIRVTLAGPEVMRGFVDALRAALVDQRQRR